MYASLFGVSGALYVSILEKPAGRIFFGILRSKTPFQAMKGRGGREA
jgi:hypothetical protein